MFSRISSLLLAQCIPFAVTGLSPQADFVGLPRKRRSCTDRFERCIDKRESRPTAKSTRLVARPRRRSGPALDPLACYLRPRKANLVMCIVVGAYLISLVLCVLWQSFATSGILDNALVFPYMLGIILSWLS